MTPTPAPLDPVSEIERLLDDAAGEAFLPPGWQRIVALLPAVVAQARRAGELAEALGEALEIIEANPGEDMCRHWRYVMECPGGEDEDEGPCIDRGRREWFAALAQSAVSETRS